MANEIVINKHALQVKQYNGQMVVTFKDIDLCHGRPEGTAKRNFNQNRKHFIEGTDYFVIPYSEFSTNFVPNPPSGGNPKTLVTLITESGYYMIVKSFTDELSWAVQRELVNSYFKYKAEPAALVPAKPYEYFDKTWKGEPVLTARDVQHMTGICRTTVVHWLRHNRTNHVDYFFLTGGDLLQFKAENPRIAKSTNSLCVVTKSGFAALCKAYCIKADEPKCFEAPPTPAPLALKTFEKEVADIKEKMVAIGVLLDSLCDFKKRSANAPAAQANKRLSDGYSAPILTTLHNLGMTISIDIGSLDYSYNKP